MFFSSRKFKVDKMNEEQRKHSAGPPMKDESANDVMDLERRFAIEADWLHRARAVPAFDHV